MLISLSLLAALAMPTCTTADSGLEKLVRDKAAELGGHEYCQFRMYDSLSDLDGDNKADFVVVFTIEGAVRGSKDVQFLAIFLSGAPSAPIVNEVGRRGYRVVTALAVSPPDIVLRVLEYEADEAICCPGDPVVISYHLACGGIQQVTHSSRLPHKHPPVASPCDAARGERP